MKKVTFFFLMSFGVFIFGLFFFKISNSFAATTTISDILNDDFESYSSGNFPDQNSNWNGDTCPNCPTVINTSAGVDGTKAMGCEDDENICATYSNTLEDLSSQDFEFSFDIQVSSTTISAKDVVVGPRYLDSTYKNVCALTLNSQVNDHWWVDINGDLTDTGFETSTDYQTIKIDYSFQDQKCSLKVDDSEYSPWYHFDFAEGHYDELQWHVGRGISGYNKFWVDNFSTYITDFSSSNFSTSTIVGVVIQPDNPTSCATSSLFSGNATGHISNMPWSDAYWNKLTISFRDMTTGQYTFASTTLSNPFFNTYYYSIPYDLSTSSTYSVTYILDGYDKDNPLIPLTYYSSGFNCPTNRGTTIGEPTPYELELEECEAALEEGQDDCASTSAWSVERYTCNISKTIRSVFEPSCAKRVQLDFTLAEVKDRAPYNYILAFANFASDLIDPTTTATSGIIAVADSISNWSFITFIRTILLCILIFGFVFVLYKTLRKLFK